MNEFMDYRVVLALPRLFDHFNGLEGSGLQLCRLSSRPSLWGRLTSLLFCARA